MDYYSLLGVNRNATPEEIKKAYRKLASQHHPDRGGDTNKFKEVQEAYDVLGDKSTRATYDNPHGFFSQRNNFDDILNTYFHRYERPNPSTRITIPITLEDAVLGTKKIISLRSINGHHPVEIDIPKGVYDGEAIRYNNIGISGNAIVVEYRVAPHGKWQRDGLNLITVQQCNFWELIAGTQKNIITMQNKTLRLNIPENTQPGAVLRLKTHGIERKGHNTGDLLVRIEAVLPDNIPHDLVQMIKSQVTK